VDRVSQVVLDSFNDVLMTTATDHSPDAAASPIDDLRAVADKLRALADAGRTDELLEVVLSLLSMMEQMRSENSQLTQQIHLLLRRAYGRSSEKVDVSQLALLFDELAESEAPESAKACIKVPDAPPLHEAEEQPPGKQGKKQRRGRQPLPPDLPREQQEVRVPDEERTCPVCGKDKQCIGHVVSEILEFVPAHFKIIEERREKLACPDGCETSVSVAPSEKVYDRGRPGPALLAHLVVSKFQDALPLYRQSQIFRRSGVRIPASTLGLWAAFAAECIQPIAMRILRWALRAHCLQVDDTGLRVLDRDHPHGVKRGHMWCHVGDSTWVAFRYAPTWEAKFPALLLRQFEGYIQVDDYKGYAARVDGPGGKTPLVPPARRLGCGMHIRRRFEQAAKGGDARGAVGLAYFKRIYEVEASCKADGLGPDDRLARRQEHSLPVLAELDRWVDDLNPKLVPDTRLQQATRYAIHQREYFARCFTDGRFEIDNGEVERQIRRVALGRKNYLFAGSDSAAERIADAYTVLGTCHLHGVDPQAYLTDVIVKLQGGWPKSRIDELLPPQWHEARQGNNPGHGTDQADSPTER